MKSSDLKPDSSGKQRNEQVRRRPGLVRMSGRTMGMYLPPLLQVDPAALAKPSIAAYRTSSPPAWMAEAIEDGVLAHQRAAVHRAHG